MGFNRIHIILFTVALVLLYSCNGNEEFISSQNENIKYTGRVNFQDPEATEIYWPGTTVKFKFRGTGINALIKDEFGDNYFN